MPSARARDASAGWAKLLPEMLRPLGYRSYHSGKWHVDGMPLENGFDRSYRLEDHDRYFSPGAHYEDDKPLPPVPPDSGYYATTAIADHAIKCLKEHAEKHAGTPFFQYVAFTAPHFPLHALPEDIARYRERYLGGWDDVRARALGADPGTWASCAGRCPPVERDVGPAVRASRRR